jgi:hypothetical protein
MDIHKPKHWHGWRELVKEVGAVVIGVLIPSAQPERRSLTLCWHPTMRHLERLPSTRT